MISNLQLQTTFIIYWNQQATRTLNQIINEKAHVLAKKCLLVNFRKLTFTIMRYLTDSYLNFHKTFLLVTSSQLVFDPNISKVYLLYKKSQKVSVETLLNAFRAYFVQEGFEIINRLSSYSRKIEQIVKTTEERMKKKPQNNFALITTCGSTRGRSRAAATSKMGSL